MLLASTTQPPLTNLFLSLAFGLVQIIIGAVMVFFTLRKHRWQQITLVEVALIGAWFACSGITELIVSGTEVLARTGSSLSTASAAHIRAQADQGFLIASLILLAIGAGYLFLSRFWQSRHATENANTPAEPTILHPESKQREDAPKSTH